MTIYLIISGMILNIFLILLLVYFIYEKIDTWYFIWNQKRQFNKHLKQQQK